MVSLRDQVDEIKSKIRISEEISKYTKLVHKGKDLWCLCFFHKEKTPSMKINDELSSYYCFGCGAKGDLISFFTDYLKYTFKDALHELGNKAGVKINTNQNFSDTKYNSNKKTFEILAISSDWFQKNLFLKENIKCLEYLKKRNITKETIKNFELGYSSNKSSSLYEYLKSKSYNDEDLEETYLFRKDKNNNLKDFFYKRIMFPIKDSYSKILGFGARTLDDIQPKYINSSESNFFKKRNLLYNLDKAKKTARKKNNLLICEGYMDVISLVQEDINSVVAPLGTAMTHEQLVLAWKTCKIPTIMFDGDLAGKKASIKSALLALKFLKPGFSLQFLELNKNEDPDTLINNLSKNEFINFLKTPKDLSSFIFDYAKDSFNYETPDQKIVFDKYFDDITDLIENKKVRFFYKKDFKNKLFAFFNNKKDNLSYSKKVKLDLKIKDLAYKELMSFIITFLNHPTIRTDLLEDITNLNFYDNLAKRSFLEISKKDNLKLSPKDLINSVKDEDVKNLLKKYLNKTIYQLFPYCSTTYNSQESMNEVKKSIKIFERRLSNLSELDKSIKDFETNVTSLKWQELKKLSYDYISEIE
tara:strand:+ start:1452 stop:3212 length:1761 start_codon:yes stop_codon:yes gene_type:complete